MRAALKPDFQQEIAQMNVVRIRSRQRTMNPFAFQVKDVESVVVRGV
jgi:hypothetical protein